MDVKYRSKPKKSNGNIFYSKLPHNSDSDDESIEQHQMVVQKKKEIATMDIEIEPDDTLQAIALRYHCSIAELKRLNFIHRENEIFAKRTLKVPIIPHSILTETIVGVHISGNSSPIKLNNQDSEIENVQEIVEKKLSRNCLFDFDSNISDLKLDATDNLVNNVPNINRSLIINDNLLNIDNKSNGINDNNLLLNNNRSNVAGCNEFYLFQGDDCGISWLYLIIFVFIICVVCPLIYIFYLAEHPEIMHHYHHH